MGDQKTIKTAGRPPLPGDLETRRAVRKMVRDGVSVNMISLIVGLSEGEIENILGGGPSSIPLDLKRNRRLVHQAMFTPPVMDALREKTGLGFLDVYDTLRSLFRKPR